MNLMKNVVGGGLRPGTVDCFSGEDYCGTAYGYVDCDDKDWGDEICDEQYPGCDSDNCTYIGS